MTIEERLTKLERKNRMLTLALVLVSLAATLVVTVGMGPPEAVPEEVKARRFILVDAYGKARAGMFFDNADPHLDLLDENGNVRLGLTVVKGIGPRLGLWDENGKLRVGLALDKDFPSLGFYDESGKGRAGLTVAKDGPRFGLYDENGKMRSGMALYNAGPTLGFYDENGKARVGLGVNKDGPRLELWDGNGQVLRTLP